MNLMQFLNEFRQLGLILKLSLGYIYSQSKLNLGGLQQIFIQLRSKMNSFNILYNIYNLYNFI